jgi:hypothetical protein
MMNKLFGIDVQMFKDSETSVTWWRYSKDRKRATSKIIHVHTDATRDRLAKLLPPPNASMTIWPESDYLSIDFMLQEKP